MVLIASEGQAIVDTTYWDTPQARAGAVLLSPNDGAIRLLIPPAAPKGLVKSLTQCKYVIVSVGPPTGQYAIEILLEDHSDEPYCLHLGATSCLMIPGELPPGEHWVCAAWTRAPNGRPHMAARKPCRWRRVSHLPWLKPWGKDKA